jgi:tRNA dimethylallyltransferase
MKKRPLLVLVGPTGIGKTAVACHMSTHVRGEIISMDSLQVYRGLDIGSAKPTPGEQAQARHHLIDICEPEEHFSAAQWAEAARRAIEDISSRGKTPLIVGGTGFYLRALLQPETLASVAPDADLRAELENEAAIHGVQHLHDRLRRVDSEAANRLHVNDVRRVIRALEVALSPSLNEGSPRMSTHAPDVAPEPDFETHVFGLEMPRALLYARIEKRIQLMLQMGFMDELQTLVSRGVPLDAPAMMGLGYKQMRAALPLPDMSTHAAAASFDACVELWKRDTRRYAKRQMTWFHHQLNNLNNHDVQWIDAENTPPESVAVQIAAQWRTKLQLE